MLVTFYSKQYGEGADDIRCQMYGTEGTIDTHYAGDVGIKGKVNFTGGRDGLMFSTGVQSQYRHLPRPGHFRAT